jgi:DNA-binding CsgD family transcriptional regulator
VRMGLQLSSTEIEQLASTIDVLVSPLAYASPGDWMAAAMADYAALQRADKVIAIVPDGDAFTAVGRGELWAEAFRDYVAYFHQFEVGLYERLNAAGLQVYGRADVYGTDRIAMKPYDEFHRDWAMVYGLCDVIGMSVPTAGNPAPFALHCYRADVADRFNERDFTLARLVSPAFKAGLRTWLTIGRRAAMLASAIDAMKDGAMIVFSNGTVAHANPALEEMIREDPEAATVRARVVHIATAVAQRSLIPVDAAADVPTADIETRLALYRVVATAIPEGAAGPVPAALATVVRLSDAWKSVAELADAFRLTPRECEVSVLLGKRLRTAEIAVRLGISVHTASRHIESVLRKLDVRTRDEVKAKILRS